MEEIRLVIWDLDETFWRGAVTEGGFEYRQFHHNIVVELALRGIISSICSRNDHAQIEAILQASGLWSFFVFPSIDWSSKGPRLKAIVEASQLRASTVLFIDDNPMNRAEAQHFVKGIQVADPSIIASVLENPLFKGKLDPDLSRLKQYRLLERRSQEMYRAEDPVEFLRDSDIRVIIDHDVESNIDRVIELINRTNQLNFTKTRLPADNEAARAQLRELIGKFDIQAGLVRVVDRYGDYGYVGFYARWSSFEHAPRLIHYCFSCRILGMQVETWLYQRLGRPQIDVQGEVLTDILDPKARIDWVQLDESEGLASGAPSPTRMRIPRIVLRGGCETVVLAHYFELLTDNLVTEFPYFRGSMSVRVDHSQITRLAVDRPSKAEMKALAALGYRPDDFATSLADPGGAGDVWILSFWADNIVPVFRHKRLGFLIPVEARRHTDGELDLTKVDLAALPAGKLDAWARATIRELKRHYEFAFLPDADSFCAAVSKVLGQLPPGAQAFILCPAEKGLQPDGSLVDIEGHTEMNRLLTATVAGFPRVTLLRIDDYIENDGERRLEDFNHFSRQVYFRLFENVRQLIGAEASMTESAAA
jgi:FkbH-like protein